jgi:hypothetical protein
MFPEKILKNTNISLDKPHSDGYNNKAISAFAGILTTHGGVTQLVE